MTSNSDGSIKLILGPMGASKTTNLILAIQRFQRQTKSTIIIKYTDDIRYSQTDIKAHNNLSHKSISCQKLSESS